MKTTMVVKPRYMVSFDYDNTIGKMLGFTKSEYKEGTYESEKIINILSVNAVLVHLNIVEGSYLNGQREPVIYSFFPNVSPGYKIIETPIHPIYLPVSLKTIRDVYIRLTDQKGELLNLRGETITIKLHIRGK
jgi:hypothetical protein